MKSIEFTLSVVKSFCYAMTMKKLMNIIIVFLLIVIVALSGVILYLRQSIVNPDSYITKEVVMEYATKYNVNTGFVRALFPDKIIYYRNSKLVFDDYNPNLKRGSFDWNLLEKKEDNYFVYVDKDVVTYQGIDVSKHNDKIDWNAVKEDGIDFAILRVGYRGYSEGKTHIDEKFHEYIQGATEAGLKVGVYFFSQAVDVAEAIEEASLVINTIKDYDIQYPVCFDMEEVSSADGRVNNLQQDEVTEITLAFCNTIQQAGYTPMIYANSNWIFARLHLEQVEHIDKWYAQYSSQPYYPYALTIWQYTESGTVNGIKGNVDRNISFVDYH